MNRAELIEALAKQTGHTKADSDRWLSAFITTVEKHQEKRWCETSWFRYFHNF